ncbi:unnamed protein product [Heligmosomoides polygyrus]|uniref:HTH_Tnp_Tc3_1 domain-containing protein n=1 Tax=Heligmosomoides polygyrus TaxID=6339 RepID=A0A183GEK9_HELPZ|nr:unnamed protein product [Heligmosomoides polygyrus]
MASALIFIESKVEYQPVTILLVSEAQRSFIKNKLQQELTLPTKGSNSTTGMGELQEIFESTEVHITLKSIRSCMKLKRVPEFTALSKAGRVVKYHKASYLQHKRPSSGRRSFLLPRELVLLRRRLQTHSDIRIRRAKPNSSMSHAVARLELLWGTAVAIREKPLN